MNTADEFWQRVLKSESGCWLWTGAVDTRRYGSLKWNGKQARAHRIAYMLASGNIPQGDGHHGVVVMHSCDNRLCCNPAHLKLGSQADNMIDMKAKGRRKGIGSGQANGRAKLTIEQVVAIRSDVRGKRTIAPEYGISPAQVQRIRNGFQWPPS
jgi:hypothetical protein